MKKDNVLKSALLWTSLLFVLPFLFPLYMLWNYGNKFIIDSFNFIYKNYGVMFLLILMGIVLILLATWQLRRSKSDLDKKVNEVQIEISKAKTKERKKLKRKLIVPKLIYNAFLYLGIFGILISEYILFGAIFLFGASLALEWTINFALVIGLGILLVFLTYHLIYLVIKWIFSKVSFWRFDFKSLGYLDAEDEDLILNWSKLVGALLFIFSVVLTMIGLLDFNIGENATTLEIINAVFTDKSTTLILLVFTIIHYIVFALRETKGKLTRK